ncbi:beta strand repeat-containing protein [Thiomicrorhabdus xiamenensis]|uniref:Uncharacterized protein n=1 Tax=Thiomicrorhabdus xiamenensis TaxID=2739063 RepID=A0A7D4NLT0_9GAMM|nr:hypothetical protein [Thiomicrorhabdus xiamenensis]QKI89494.1 hypothetical protein HQN79_07890 [Thiomicrorhabdus xiamenensis]
MTEFDITTDAATDPNYEGDEFYDVTVGGVAATGTITDTSEITVESVTSDTQPEGSTLTHTVTMSGESINDETYSFSIADNTTEPEDWSNLQFTNGVVNNGDGTITVPAGVTEFDITTDAATDPNYEGDEFYDVTVGGVAATGTITDTSEITVESVTSDTQPEGSTLTHTVTMSGESINDETYSFSIADNTTEPEDWSNLQFTNGVVNNGDGTITVPAGVTEFDITTDAATDPNYEGDEFYDVTVGGVAATGTITDTSEITVESVTSDTQPEGSTLTHTVTMSGESINDETYSFSIADNTTEPEDWSNLQFTNGVVNNGDGTITVPAGVTEFDITTYAEEDADYEGTEFYDVTVGGVAATGTILDNDALATDISVDEDDIASVVGNPGGVDDLTTPVISGTLTYDLGGQNLDSIMLSTNVGGLNQTGLSTVDGTAVLTLWDPVSNTLIGYKDGAPSGDEGLPDYLVFEVEVTSLDNSGASYEITLYQPLQHHEPASADDTEANDLVLPIDVVVNASGGLQATTSFDLTIDDDTPINFMADISAVAPGDGVTDVPLNFSAGADGAGADGYSISVADGQQVTNADGQLLFFGPEFKEITWNSVSSTEVQGVVDAGTVDEQAVFTLSINSDGTYNFSAVDGQFLVQTDDVPFTNDQPVQAGNDTYYGIVDLGGTDTDVVVTGTGAVNTNSVEFGTGNTSLNAGQFLNFEFYSDSTLNGGSETDPRIGSTESEINNFTFTVSDTASNTTPTFSVTAYDSNGDAVAVTVVDSNGIPVATNLNGSYTAIEGYDYKVVGDEPYANVVITGVDGNSTGTNFSVVISGFSSINPSDVALSFDATATDMDGDSASGTIVVGIDQVSDGNDDSMFEDVSESASVEQDTVLSGNLLLNVIDNDADQTHQVTDFTVDGDATTYAAGDTAVISGVGSLTVDGNGDYSFTPETGYVGAVPEVTYSVLDVNDTAPEDTDTSTLNIEVVATPVAAMMVEESFDYAMLETGAGITTLSAELRTEFDGSFEDLVQTETEGEVALGSESPAEGSDEGGQDLLAQEASENGAGNANIPDGVPDHSSAGGVPGGAVDPAGSEAVQGPDETMKQIIDSELDNN